ncbi:hypothetical protein FHK02_5664 [Spirosoma sp. LMG 31448]|nr:hypothetical protein [Spirosoma utsteinense]
MKLQDTRELIYEPPANEQLIWELITYLYGIDMPSMRDRTQLSRGDLDIIDFLKKVLGNYIGGVGLIRCNMI